MAASDPDPSLRNTFRNYVALQEWLLLVIAMLLVAASLGWQNGLGRIDQTLYDHLVTASGRPARDDIIIVAIDDYSLAQLGRWPWPRALHAKLIDQLARSRPRTIGLDIILSEPEAAPSAGDSLLQTAMEQYGRVVLPVVTSHRGKGFVASLPIPSLAGAAYGLGHVALDIDRDGVTRKTYLYEGKVDGERTKLWPHFALKIGGESLHLQGPSSSLTMPQSDTSGWQRREPMLIPFAGGSGHFKSVPYVAVLRGEVPAGFFADKYVLVGATAIGMADSYPTPVTGTNGGMAGVEIHANILASLLDNKSIVPTLPIQVAIFSCIPVLIALLCCYLFSPRTALIVSALLLLMTALGTLAAFRAGYWIPPGGACIALLMAYPLWSWRRLEAAIDYLGREFQRLDREPHLLPEIRTTAPALRTSADVLDRHINAMRRAVRRVRDLRVFVSDSLNSLPDATLVTTTDGYVLLANTHAVDYFAGIGIKKVHGALLPLLFATPGQTMPRALDPAIDHEFNWWNLLDPAHAATFETGVDFRNQTGADLLVRSAPCRASNQQLTGWIVSIVDISAIRSAERSRDETLRFLSHDMRAPQASILALLELQGDPASALPLPELFLRIEKASRRTLGLADNFVQLARAESNEYRLDEIDFHDIVIDATDALWSLAKARGICVSNDFDTGVDHGSGTDSDTNDCSIMVDRSLMTRALENLLSNAINYSPAGATITWSLHARTTPSGRAVVCSITDHGYGITVADQPKLFRRFKRIERAGQPHHDGIGLGLLFVKTVVERHHGTIAFSSEVGIGTTFTITLPTAANRTTVVPGE